MSQPTPGNLAAPIEAEPGFFIEKVKHADGSIASYQVPEEIYIWDNYETASGHFISFSGNIQYWDPESKKTRCNLRKNGAAIAINSSIDPSVSIGPRVVVGNNVEIGKGSVVNEGSIVGQGVMIGSGSTIHKEVVLAGRTCLRDNVRIGPLSELYSTKVDTNTSIGKNVITNFGVDISHNVKISDGVKIRGQATIHAQSVINSRAEVGLFSIILHDTVVPKNTIVPDWTVVSNNPSTYSFMTV